jgi:magnesium-transporting ATPase (P-type)
MDCRHRIRIRARSGATQRIVKGAFASIIGLAHTSPTATELAKELEGHGFRVLAVGAGPPTAMKLAGLIALSDPPRSDSAALVTELHGLGVRTVMVTGDAPATAAIVAHAVGLDGAVCPPGPIPDNLHPEHRGLDGNRRRQIGRWHGADRAWTRRHRRRDQGRAGDVRAHPDLHAELHHQ